MADGRNHLGEYLRARRALVSPEQAGVPDLGGRRVPGLRREEVAMLAGISADYYLRLERGRDRNPSVQVLESIARVLLLDGENLQYLLSLAADKPRRRRPRPRAEAVPVGVAKLLPQLTQPAYVEGRYFDVLAANAMATALSPRLTAGRNQLRDMFLDPGEIALHPDWDGTIECLISSLRQGVGADIDDVRFIELVGELSLASPRFRALWSRHDVGVQRGSTTEFDHPQVGALRLHRERLTVNGTDGIHLVVYHADAGSEDAEKLALLGSSTGAGHHSTAIAAAANDSTPTATNIGRGTGRLRLR
jgi:transcriptional regulator with XRE-family HTH domain